jgi:plastocyanin
MQTVTLTRPRKAIPATLGLAAALVLAACSQGNAPSTAPSPTTPSSTTPPSATSPPSTPSAAPPATARASAGRRIDIVVKGKQVTPAPGTVNLAVGQSLTIAVTSDHDDEVHAHGFEVEKKIKAGQRLEFTVKGTQTGVFTVELHHPALNILQVAVR